MKTCRSCKHWQAEYIDSVDATLRSPPIYEVFCGAVNQFVRLRPFEGCPDGVLHEAPDDE